MSGEGADLAEYLYMGVASRVQTYYPTPDARMRLFGSAGSGDPYTSLDRFGRLTEVLWEDASASAALDEFAQGLYAFHAHLAQFRQAPGHQFLVGARRANPAQGR